MSVIVKHISHTYDLDTTLKKTYIDTILVTEDNLAHCFDVTLLKGGEAVTLPDGAAVTAYFIRYSDNATITLTDNTISGNVVSATLKKACYNKAGQYAIIIKVTADGIINTMFYGEGTIFTSVTDTILDEENVIPSLSDLLAQIAAMESATAASKTATTNAKTATTRANNAAAKIEGMTVSAEASETAGATISEVNGVKHIAFALPKGDKGDKGDPGTIENVTITSIVGLEEALAGKLGTGDTAANANQLNGKDADQYALVSDLPTKASDIDAQPAGDYLTTTGTAADSEKLGGEAPEYYKSSLSVLWSNPSISSTFEAQSVVLSDAVENYDFLIIECVRSSTNSSRIAGIFVCGGVSKNYIVFDEYFYRYANNIGGTNVTFGGAYSADSGDNGRALPSRIYGVKLGGV